MTVNLRAVFDCNVYFQALIRPSGPAGKCVKLALEGRIDLFCSASIIEEIRRTASHPKIRAKFSSITDAEVVSLIQSIERVGRFPHNIPEVFTHDRDPDDAHYVNLALVTNAKYVVSRDNDLLDLMDRTRPEGRDFRARFPSLEIIPPETLLRELERARRSTTQPER